MIKIYQFGNYTVIDEIYFINKKFNRNFEIINGSNKFSLEGDIKDILYCVKREYDAIYKIYKIACMNGDMSILDNKLVPLYYTFGENKEIKIFAIAIIGLFMQNIDPNFINNPIMTYLENKLQEYSTYDENMFVEYHIEGTRSIPLTNRNIKNEVYLHNIKYLSHEKHKNTDYDNLKHKSDRYQRDAEIRYKRKNFKKFIKYNKSYSVHIDDDSLNGLVFGRNISKLSDLNKPEDIYYSSGIYY